MLLSKTKKFIFIHIPKNAGQSITSILLNYCLSDSAKFAANLIGSRTFIRINTKMKKYFNQTLYDHNFKDHERAYKVKDLLGESYSDYFKFAIVRNPWDWLFSQYNYTLKNPRHFRHKFVKSNFSSFNEYVQWDCLNNDKRKCQKEFVLDRSGNKIIDYIGKFENLEYDFGEICRIIGVDVRIPHFNQSNKNDYRKYYSRESRDLVSDYYSSDIELFDYEF